ncbi:MAG: four helix bundle protein [Acidobacteria bacterium]|nr:four helix bundle protein [Acidobacteriota bacterium]
MGAVVRVARVLNHGSAMGSIGSFRDLEVWQLSMSLVQMVFEVTKRFPPREFELRRQMCSAAISTPSNVAEGYRRLRRGAYQNHVSIALGSNAELDTGLEVATRVRLVTSAECAEAVDTCQRVGAMLFKLHQSLDG